MFLVSLCTMKVTITDISWFSVCFIILVLLFYSHMFLLYAWCCPLCLYMYIYIWFLFCALVSMKQYYLDSWSDNIYIS